MLFNKVKPYSVQALQCMGSSSSSLENSKSTVDPSLAASTTESECPVAPSKREAIYNVYNQRIDTGKLAICTKAILVGL